MIFKGSQTNSLGVIFREMVCEPLNIIHRSDGTLPLGRPTLVPAPGADLKGVFTIRTMNDIQRLTDHLAENNAKRVAIIGAGLTGSEMAEALLQRDVSVIEAEIVPEILPVLLDPDMASLIRTLAEEHAGEY